MKPLFFLMRKELKNYLIELLKKPFLILIYVITIGMVVFALWSSMHRPVNPAATAPLATLKAIITVALLTLTYYNVKRGIENGSTFFRQADVNLVFSAPISPKRILIYGFLKQLSVTFLSMIFLMAQLPNLQSIYALSAGSLLVIMAAVFLFFLALPLVGMLIYAIASQSHKARKVCQRVLDGVAVLIGAGFFLHLLQVRDLLGAVRSFFGTDLFNHLPLVGWFRAVILSNVTGDMSTFYWNAGLLAAFFVAALFILYKVNTDYYEDVLSATERRESILQAQKEGRSIQRNSYGKIKRARQRYLGTGGWAILSRHLLEYKKKGFFFLDKYTLILVGWGIGSKYFSHSSIISTLFYSAYFAFFLTLQGKWAQELNKPYIYLLPISSLQKIFYGTLAESLKNVVDGFAIFVAAGLVFKSTPLTIVLCALAYATYANIFIYGEVFIRKSFGDTLSKYLALFKMLLMALILSPGIVIALVTYTTIGEQVPYAQYLFFLILLAYNLIVSFLMLLSSKKIFEYLDMP